MVIEDDHSTAQRPSDEASEEHPCRILTLGTADSEGEDCEGEDCEDCYRFVVRAHRLTSWDPGEPLTVHSV